MVDEDDLVTRSRTFLLDDEKVWADRYEQHLKAGYELRSRYKPGWKASWLVDPSLRKLRCQDAIGKLVRSVSFRLLVWLS